MNFENNEFPNDEDSFEFPSKEEINKVCLPLTKIEENEDILEYIPNLPNMYSKRTVKRCKKIRKREIKKQHEAFILNNMNPNIPPPPPPKINQHSHFLFPESRLFPIQQTIDPNRRYDNINIEPQSFDFDEMRTRLAFRLDHGVEYKPFFIKKKKKKKKKTRIKIKGEGVVVADESTTENSGKIRITTTNRRK